MGVKIADKLEQFNNGTYYLVDSSAVEYVDKDGNTKSVKEALDGTSTDTSTHKTVIFENNIDMGKYLLLAKITGANYSNNIIKFSCPNYKGVNDAGFKYENDMDIYKFELHFNTGATRETNSYGVTLKQHGLGLYSYPLSNPKNTEPSLEEAIRLYWDYSKGDIYVFLVDMMTAIPHCVLEYTGSGTLLRENTFVMDDLYNRRDGLNGTWEESKWKSIPFNKLEIPPIHELGGGSTEGVKTYTSLEALGLTADATIEDVVNALKKGESFLAPVNTFTNYETIFPNKVPNDKWNKIHIIKGTSLASSHIRCFSQSGTCEYLANINNTNVVSWNDVSGTYIDISDSIIEKLGNEILKYPVGKYRINSSATGNKFTDLPSDAETKCGLIEVNGTGVSKSPFTDTCVYRMYKFECLTGTSSYIRRLNSGNTVGQIEVDTGWQEISSRRNVYYNINQLNSAKGTSIQLVAGEDNTLKIVEALGSGDEFTQWYNNNSTMDRFGIPNEFGHKITYFRIVKTDPKYALIIATTSRGFTFSRVYNVGVLEDWCWDRSKATLVTNTSTLKLDVTKRNSYYYGAVKLTYLYDVSPVEVEIGFRAQTDNLRWTVINGKRYINKITFTQDSSDTAHYTIGIEFVGTTYGCYQVEVIGGFADINSLTNDSFTGNKTAVYYSPDGKNNGVSLVSLPEDIGLTFPCTTVQLVQAMRNKFNTTITTGTIGVFDCVKKTESITDAPSDYGLLHIETFGHDRVLIRFDGIGSSTYVGSWIGKIKGNNGTFSSIEWERIDGVVSTGGEPAVYSTSEQAIGTWVDGKTIYRKTIIKDTHSVNAQLMTGIDTFIRGYGSCERAGYIYNVPYCGLLAGHLTDEDVTYLNFKLDKSTGVLSTIANALYAISNLKVTIEYTKK